MPVACYSCTYLAADCFMLVTASLNGLLIADPDLAASQIPAASVGRRTESCFGFYDLVKAGLLMYQRLVAIRGKGAISTDVFTRRSTLRERRSVKHCPNFTIPKPY